MSEGLYYYSMDGSVVRGPANLRLIRSLFAQGVLTESSLICQEGDAAWRNMDPQMFVAIEDMPRAAFVAPTPPSRLPQKAQATRVRRRKAPSGGRGFDILDGMTGLLGLALVLAMTAMEWAAGRIPNGSYACGGVAGGIFIVIIVPRLVARAVVNPAWRSAIFLLGVLTLFSLSVLAQPGAKKFPGTLAALWPNAVEQARIWAVAEEFRTGMLHDARRQITTGHYDTAAMQGDIQRLKAVIGTGDSDVDREARDLLQIDQELLDQVRVMFSDLHASKMNSLPYPDANDLTNRELSAQKVTIDQQAMVRFLQHLDQKCRAALARDGFSEGQIEICLRGFRAGAKVDALIALGQANMVVMSDYVSFLNFLKNNLYGWRQQNGRIEFLNQEARVAFVPIAQSFLRDFRNQQALARAVNSQIFR